MAKRKVKKRGPKVGIKHQPGRGHNRKSLPHKKAKFERNAERRRLAMLKEARRQWLVWDGLSEDRKRILPDLKPTLPRPTDEI